VNEKVQVRASFYSNRMTVIATTVQWAGRRCRREVGPPVCRVSADRTLHGVITAEYTHQNSLGDAMQNIAFIYDDTGALVHDKPAG
jgi:hypothetical protein